MRAPQAARSTTENKVVASYIETEGPAVRDSPCTVTPLLLEAMRDKTSDTEAPQIVLPALRFEIPEAALILRMSRAQLYHRIRDGALKVQKDGARTYITRAELERYVDSCNALEAAFLPVAWMAEDGRVVNAESKRTCRNASLDGFVIPLYRAPSEASAPLTVLRVCMPREKVAKYDG